MATIDERYFEQASHLSSQRRYALVTVRLSHSIPFSAREKLMDYRLRCGGESERDINIQKAAQLFAYWDLVLDLSPGPRWLEHPEVAESARRALRDVDGVLCDVRAWVLLPTHIHVLAAPCPVPGAAPGILHLAEAIKAPVAHKARTLLRVSTPLWEDGAHMHLLDSAADLDRTLRYLRQEPVRAGLVTLAEEWEWRGEK